MSYEMVERITIKPDGVYYCSASNNVTPRYFYSAKSNYSTDILNTQGQEALIKHILFEFSSGTFKAHGHNEFVLKLQQAADKARNNDQYYILDDVIWGWDNGKTQAEKDEARKEFETLLYNEYLKTA